MNDVIMAALIGAVVGSVLPPILDRMWNAQRDKVRAARVIRDNFYAIQTHLAKVNAAGSWGDLVERAHRHLLGGDDDFRLVARHLNGKSWADVSGARRRWLLLLDDLEAGVDVPLSEVHETYKWLEQARRSIASADRGMPFDPHKWTRDA